MSNEKTRYTVCGEFKFNWQSRHVPFYDVWVCKKHPDSEVEKKLKKRGGRRNFGIHKHDLHSASHSELERS